MSSATDWPQLAEGAVLLQALQADLNSHPNVRVCTAMVRICLCLVLVVSCAASPFEVQPLFSDHVPPVLAQFCERLYRKFLWSATWYHNCKALFQRSRDLQFKKLWLLD